MTSEPLLGPGDVLAGRYRLVDRLDGDDGCERFRAQDERLHREVLVEVARSAGAAEQAPAAGVRSLSGADDTGLHAVLDGGTVAGRPFAVRELPGPAHDATSPAVTAQDVTAPALPVVDATVAMQAVDRDAEPTAVFPAPLPLADVPPPAPVDVRRGQRPVVLGLVAALALVLLVTGLAFGAARSGDDSSPREEVTSTSTTSTTEPSRSSTRPTVATTAPPTTVATTLPPTTEPPTIVVDPEPLLPPGPAQPGAGPDGADGGAG